MLSFHSIVLSKVFFFFFFNDTATTEIYTLSLHDALPISFSAHAIRGENPEPELVVVHRHSSEPEQVEKDAHRSEEHTSELQSQFHLVCRLLLEKKKKRYIIQTA